MSLKHNVTLIVNGKKIVDAEVETESDGLTGPRARYELCGAVARLLADEEVKEREVSEKKRPGFLGERLLGVMNGFSPSGRAAEDREIVGEALAYLDNDLIDKAFADKYLRTVVAEIEERTQERVYSDPYLHDECVGEEEHERAVDEARMHGEEVGAAQARDDIADGYHSWSGWSEKGLERLRRSFVAAYRNGRIKRDVESPTLPLRLVSGEPLVHPEDDDAVDWLDWIMNTVHDGMARAWNANLLGSDSECALKKSIDEVADTGE